MLRQFASRSPKAATAIIYLAGYLAGSLLGALADYLIRARVDSAVVTACGLGVGTIAIVWARHRRFVPEPEDLNKPITLFGSDSHPQNRQ